MHVLIRRCQETVVEVRPHLLNGDAAFHDFLAPEWDAQLVQPLLDLFQGVCLHSCICKATQTWHLTAVVMQTTLRTWKLRWSSSGLMSLLLR